jgi:V/A-type H+-transporting ATPase subunit G/H
MDTEHSLLDQISRKEAELKEECDQVCKEAEDRIHNARIKAREMREEAERSGADTAAKYMENGLSELALEISKIRGAGEKEAERILHVGKERIDKAVLRIVEMVLG